MIELEVSFSGAQLGCKLAQDEEELFYALVEMTDFKPERLGKEVAGYCGSDDADKIAAWLRKLADVIGGGDV